MLKEWANVNELWADVLVETLRRKGVDYAILCPGSRCSPLTFAFARNKNIEAISVFDERSAGFFALGLAKRTGKPVALVCTSGSAVANLFPSVVEASEGGAPLILLTADRPPELRNCGAGQTIDQVKFFGGYVRDYLELAAPEANLGMLQYLRQQLAHVADLSSFPNRGPVHVNVPFRDPLTPVREPSFECPFGGEEEYYSFFAELSSQDSSSILLAQLPAELGELDRGLIVVGPCSPINEEVWCENVAALANTLAWPVLADALNPIRSNSTNFQSLISGYDFILRSPDLLEELAPEHVLVLGSLPTSKQLREWLTKLDVPMTMLSDRPLNRDATHSRSRLLYVDFENEGVVAPPGRADAYCERWLSLDDRVAEELESRFQDTEELFEGKVAWMLSHCLPEWSALCVSNSMPPRDMEFYFPIRKIALSVYSSRGANGIDGILSTAMGVAHEGEPSYLLTGDLALLHDTNGALISKVLKGSLTIVLVNNSGGGIFEMLPVAAFEDVFEKYYATDQEIDFSLWSKTYGISYELMEDWDELGTKLGEIADGVRILEVRTDRKRDADLRKQWFAEIAETLT